MDRIFGPEEMIKMKILIIIVRRGGKALRSDKKSVKVSSHYEPFNYDFR